MHYNQRNLRGFDNVLAYVSMDKEMVKWGKQYAVDTPTRGMTRGAFALRDKTRLKSY